MKTPLHEALRQVRQLQQTILEKQRFKGYSGRARALSGCVALGAALLLDSPLVPQTVETHLLAWALVFLFGLALNYGALVYWFWHDPEVGRDLRRLRPALEVVPTLLVGGLLTLALVDRQQYDMLFGMWMVVFGLTNFPSRQVLPRGLPWVGMFYIAFGAVCLLLWPLSFIQDSLVMGGVFFAGEFFGGLILHFDEKPMPSLRTFFGLPAAPRAEGDEANS
jgi:hypothetical protein